MLYNSLDVLEYFTILLKSIRDAKYENGILYIKAELKDKDTIDTISKYLKIEVKNENPNPSRISLIEVDD